MKSPKIESKLVNKVDGSMVGTCGQMHVLTFNRFWSDTFNAFSLKNSIHHQDALHWAIEEVGQHNLKWVPLCDLP